MQAKSSSQPPITVDSSYHYPPELLELLVDTIPSLVKAKRAVIDFFRGAGTPAGYLKEWEDKLRTDRYSVKKRDIARSVLCQLNDAQDAALGVRREIIKRVTEFEDFSTCYESDRLKAQGLVAQIRHIVEVKDAFARMNIERERERRERQKSHEAAVQDRQRRIQEREEIKRDLGALFGESDPHKRGKALEGVLNRLFKSHDILVKEAFTLKGNAREGIIEQIDGAVEFDGNLYLVEMKWWEPRIGRQEIGPHLVSVFSRGDARGIFISKSGYTDAAVDDVKGALHLKVCILVELEEIVKLLDKDGDLKEMLRLKVRAAIIEKEPLLLCSSETSP